MRAILISFAILSAGTLCAQEPESTPLEIGRTFRIPSQVLSETRTIDVSLPSGYAENTDRRYPLIVVLDGEFEHQIAAATARFYSGAAQLPQVIVVGVHNTDRTRDMTPGAEAGYRVPPEARNSGGADRFLSFLEGELLPHLERTYRTSPMRVLTGHSLTGLFAVYALNRRPQLFTGWIVMEPSLWWNDQAELRTLRTVLRTPAARRARVMMVNTEETGLDTTQWGGPAPMVRHLATRNETHTSMALSGMMQGLRQIFADFRPSEWRPGTRPIAMLDRYDSLTERLGYAVPIPSSAFALAARMSIDSRHYDDAMRILDRMERELGPSEQSRSLRAKYDRDRASPAPGFIPLEFPARRPTPREARGFIGRWQLMGPDSGHVIIVRASGDTVVVRDSLRMRNFDWSASDNPVVQVTADGTLEWGLPWFRGLAALLILRGRVMDDGTMTVTREARGWVPVGPGGDFSKVERFRRIGS